MKFENFRSSFFQGKINKRDLINLIKTSISDFDSLRKFYNRLEKELTIASNLFDQVLLGRYNLPRKYSELNKSDLQFRSKTLEQEMSWQVLGFIKCADHINTFIKLRNAYENLILKGHYEDARNILNQIEEKVCVSFWSVENRLILDEYQYGTERNWETRNVILNDENDVFLRILGDMFSIRSEHRVPFFQYNQVVNTWIENQHFDLERQQSFIEYFRFKGNYFSHSKYIHLKEIIFLDNSSSLIDRYLSFIRVSQHLILDTTIDSNFLYSLYSAIKLSIEDSVIDKILFATNHTYKIPPNETSPVLSIIDYYTKGSYFDAIELCKKHLNYVDSSDMELYEIYAKSLIESRLNYEVITEEESLANRISKLYYDILLKDENTDNAYVELMGLSYVFGNSKIGLYLYSFIKEDLGWGDEIDIDYSFVALLNSSFINPKLSNHLYKVPEIFNNFIISSNPNESLTAKLYLDFYTQLNKGSDIQNYESVPEIKKMLYTVRNLMLSKNYEYCITLYNDILLSNDKSIIANYEILSGLFYCYLVKKDFRHCVILNIDAYLSNTFFTKRMNNGELLKEIISGKFKNIGDRSDLIELPIFFKIYCNDKIKVKQAYELFLHSNNVTRPGDLLDNIEKFERKKYIFFLSNVCIPEIMQLSKSFDSTYAVNEERIEICKFLTEFDPLNEVSYKIEIVELTQKNTISRVIGGIDERKIFVNESKIRQIIKKTEKQNVLQTDQISPLTNDSFDRYIKLANYVKTNNEYRDVSSIIQFGDNGEITYMEVDRTRVYGQYDADVVLYLPAFRIFITFFLYIKDLFVFSKEFGLDAYLSTRIRHGTLPNHLRSVFETYSLVTSQTDNIYSENIYWDDKLTITKYELQQIQECLSKFSLEVDSYSREIKDTFIQCRNERKGSSKESLFNFNYNEEELIWLFLNDFREINNIDDFIDKCFFELWKRTEVCLGNIRQKFNVDFKDYYVKLIDSLQADILVFTDRASITELLTNLMICKTEIQTKLNNISKWFRRSESSYDGEYELKILVETSIQITKNIHPNYNFKMDKNILDDFNVKGEYHQHFIDLINNFLFNMIKHSNVISENLKASIEIKEESNLLIFQFKNSISEDVFNTAKLEDIKRNWQVLDSNISHEGGTGFPKIKKIIHSDLNRTLSNFDYTIIDNTLSFILSFETKDLKI